MPEAGWRGIPPGMGVRVVGDVHGDMRGFAHAIATDLFVVQLGDLVDHGPDSAGALRAMLDLQAAGRGLFILGNHDFKLARALTARDVYIDSRLEKTLGQIDDALRDAAVPAIQQAPAWLRWGPTIFVHAGFHTAMLETDPPAWTGGGAKGVLARALYGEVTGRMQEDGFPERNYEWVHRIPAGLTVYCGHDWRGKDGRPYIAHGKSGGRAIFLDTGAGKGGHVSWIDLPPLG